MAITKASTKLRSKAGKLAILTSDKTDSISRANQPIDTVYQNLGEELINISNTCPDLLQVYYGIGMTYAYTNGIILDEFSIIDQVSIEHVPIFVLKWFTAVFFFLFYSTMGSFVTSSSLLLLFLTK